MAIWRSSPETFVVEEVPAYEPCGVGAHTYLWIEKRGLTTPEATRRLARALGVRDRDAGHAGLKDVHATTRQWLSFPDVAPEAALAAVVDGVRVLRAGRHGNKLRIGHLRGNRFEVVLTEVADGEVAVLGEALAALGRAGLPNRYGDQRFGVRGDNVETALAVLRRQRREPDPRRRRFFYSAIQSAVFNGALALREASGALCRVREGDVLQKVQTGGLFVTEDPVQDQARVDAGEVVPTGPLPGNREIEPPPGTEARALEDQALAALGIGREELAPLGRELPGARRPVVVRISLEAPATVREGTSLRLRFGLPSGSYATVLVEALAARAALAAGEAVLTFPAPASP